MKARRRSDPKRRVWPSKHIGPPLCSAPESKGSGVPCAATALYVINPEDPKREIHVCQKHYEAFEAYFDDSDEERPPVKQL